MGFFSVITWCVWDGGLHMSKGIIRYSKMSGYPCLSKKRSYSLITSNNNRFLRSLLSYSLFLKKNREYCPILLECNSFPLLKTPLYYYKS